MDTEQFPNAKAPFGSSEPSSEHVPSERLPLHQSIVGSFSTQEEFEEFLTAAETVVIKNDDGDPAKWVAFLPQEVQDGIVRVESIPLTNRNSATGEPAEKSIGYGTTLFDAAGKPIVHCESIFPGYMGEGPRKWAKVLKTLGIHPSDIDSAHYRAMDNGGMPTVFSRQEVETIDGVKYPVNSPEIGDWCEVTPPRQLRLPEWLKRLIGKSSESRRD